MRNQNKVDPMKPVEVDPGETLKPVGGMSAALHTDEAVTVQNIPPMPKSELIKKGYIRQ